MTSEFLREEPLGIAAGIVERHKHFGRLRDVTDERLHVYPQSKTCGIFRNTVRTYLKTAKTKMISDIQSSQNEFILLFYSF